MENPKPKHEDLAVKFCNEHRTFHASNLHAFFDKEFDGLVAPASADRALRYARAHGRVGYTVDRRRSFYTVSFVALHTISSGAAE